MTLPLIIYPNLDRFTTYCFDISLEQRDWLLMSSVIFELDLWLLFHLARAGALFQVHASVSMWMNYLLTLNLFLDAVPLEILALKSYVPFVHALPLIFKLFFTLASLSQKMNLFSILCKCCCQ